MTPLHMNQGALALVLLAALVAGLDQAVKALALRHLTFGVPIHLIEGLMALRLGLNPGLAFGLLGGLEAPWRWVVAVFSVGALLLLARVAYRVLPTAGVFGRLAIGLIFGGAIGNLIDRARHGAVVDFIDLYWSSYHWPAFNVADSAISIGVIILAVTLMRQDARPVAAPRS